MHRRLRKLWSHFRRRISRRKLRSSRMALLEPLEARHLLAADIRVSCIDELLDGISTLDFGVTPRYEPASRTLTIRNEGTDVLALDPATINLPFGFSLVSPFSQSVLPGYETQLTFQLDTDNLGAFSGMLSFQTNDPVVGVFDITVSGFVDSPPTATPIANFIVTEGAADTTLNLNSYFQDVEDAELQQYFAYSSDESLVTVSVDHQTGALTFQYPGEVGGVATITVGVVDSHGLLTESTLDVTVFGVNDPPIAVSPQPYKINEFSGDYFISLHELFTDPDTPWNELVFSVSDNSNPDNVTWRLDTVDGYLILNVGDTGGADATISVAATDPLGGLSTIPLTLDVNAAPRSIVPEAYVVTIDSSADFASLSGATYFFDADAAYGELTYSLGWFESADSWVQSVVVAPDTGLVQVYFAPSPAGQGQPGTTPGAAYIALRATDSFGKFAQASTTDTHIFLFFLGRKKWFFSF